jgi:hypothetical protein
MSNAPGYRIHPSFQRQQSEHDGMVYQATYVIEDDNGVRGAPVVVSGTFTSAEEAMEAAREAGTQVLAQLK